MRLVSTIAAMTMLVMLTVVSSDCAKAPRQRPVKMGPVDTGEGSIEEERRELQGSWSLLTLEIVDAAGRREPVKASGLLSFDMYGNLTVSGTIDDPRAEAIPLAYSGRIVIDAVKHVYYPADVEVEKGVSADTERLAPVSLDKVRQYSVTRDTLIVTYLNRSGEPTAVATWRRASDR